MEALKSFAGAQDTIMLNTGHSTDDNMDLSGALPANLYFTICDDISNESNEFVAINNSTSITQIKEIQRRGGDSGCDQPLQYRILSQLPKTSVDDKAVTLRAVTMDGTRCNTAGNASSLLPANTTVQLPSGCEIYLVKEYIDSDGGEILECEEAITPHCVNSITNNINSNATQTLIKSSPPVSILSCPSIKTEPGTQTPFGASSNVITSKVENNLLKTTAGSVASSYRKRDEKRRATHNEVERRRRDKINSWIFKLKEMLPKDVSNSSSIGLKSKLNHGRLPADGFEKSHQSIHRGSTSCRSPPNDSKSQILIKACEYIRAMQDELKTLRECLMENDKLRTSNLSLQNELEKYKNTERRQQQHQPTHPGCDDTCYNDTNNCCSPSEDFTLTLCSNGSNNLDDVSSSTLFTTTPTSPNSISVLNGRKTSISVPFAKRELIITDYVD